MTQPVQEPTQARVDQGQEFRSRQLFRRPSTGSSSPVWVNYEIKVFRDGNPALVGDGAFFFPIPFPRAWVLSLVVSLIASAS